MKTNKTNVIKNIEFWNDEKELKEVKDILHYKSILRKKTNEDIEGITYLYNSIVDLYCLACKQLFNNKSDSAISFGIKKAIKWIYQSDIEINSYNKEYLDYLNNYGLLD